MSLVAFAARSVVQADHGAAATLQRTCPFHSPIHFYQDFHSDFTSPFTSSASSSRDPTLRFHPVARGQQSIRASSAAFETIILESRCSSELGIHHHCLSESPTDQSYPKTNQCYDDVLLTCSSLLRDIESTDTKFDISRIYTSSRPRFFITNNFQLPPDRITEYVYRHTEHHNCTAPTAASDLTQQPRWMSLSRPTQSARHSRRLPTSNFPFQCERSRIGPKSLG